MKWPEPDPGFSQTPSRCHEVCVWEERSLTLSTFYLCCSCQVGWSTPAAHHSAWSQEGIKPQAIKTVCKINFKELWMHDTAVMLWKSTAGWVLLKGCSWATGKVAVEIHIEPAGVSWARQALREHREASTFSTATENGHTKKIFQGAKWKREQKTQKAGNLQHCRQSGRLLKIAGNRHTAGSQGQK